MSKMKKIGYIAGFMGVVAIAAGCAKEQESIAPTPVPWKNLQVQPSPA